MYSTLFYCIGTFNLEYWHVCLQPTDEALRHCAVSLQAPPAAETAQARPACPRHRVPRRLQPGSSCGRQSFSTDLTGTRFSSEKYDLKSWPCLRCSVVVLPFLSFCMPESYLTGLLLLFSISWVLLSFWCSDCGLFRFPHRDLQRLPPNEA